MKFDSEEVIKAKYYSNLFMTATKLVDRHIKEPFVIASNCISLIAGLTFHLLKNYRYDYKVAYYCKDLTLDHHDVKQFIIVNSVDVEALDNVTLYFYYEGQEAGILCVE